MNFMIPELLRACSIREVAINNNTVYVMRLRDFSDGMCFELAMFPGGNYGLHHHKASDERVYVIKGDGIFTSEGKDTAYRSRNVFHVPKGAVHGLNVRNKTLVLSVQGPAIFNLDTGKADMYKNYR